MRASARPTVGRDVGETAGGVAEEHVGAIAEADEEVEIAVGVHVDPRGLAHRAGGHREIPRFGRDIDEARAIVAIQAQHGSRAGRAARGREADEQIRIAVRVEISPRGRAGRPRVGDARGRGDIREHAAVVAIQAVGRAVEADEQIDVAVAVVVRRGVHERPAGGEQIRLHRPRTAAARAAGRQGGASGDRQQ